ncbi:MAG: cytochrome c1, partial [Hyphomicrobium sp.]
MKKLISLSAASLLAMSMAAGMASAAGTATHEIERQAWSFGGFKGQFDRAQLHRGFQVYKEVCAACHNLRLVKYRNLGDVGGPQFS